MMVMTRQAVRREMRPGRCRALGESGMEKPPLRVAFFVRWRTGHPCLPVYLVNRIRQTISMSPGPSLWTACHSPSGQTAVSPAWSMTSVPLSS